MTNFPDEFQHLSPASGCIFCGFKNGALLEKYACIYMQVYIITKNHNT
ncbi:hypothetical protein DCCM_4399 [Desulfocucumis palustris]|uniref:Uncharacterized protein n=1 Tax=Desulfocucumis palustris TaxID=1898651 RepID=A0A2L2XLT9_9FIRM|nr:hypothetical protein DCCM_4399 [Desulfocucumis palustris]